MSCFILALLSAAIMALTAIQYTALLKSIRKDQSNLSLSARIIRITSLVLPYFFVLGYLVGAIDVMVRDVEPIFYFVIVMFFAGGVFVFILVQNQISMTRTLKEKNDELQDALGQIEDHNRRLKAEIEVQVREIIAQDEMLRIVNDVASILLAADMHEFERILRKCMGMLAGIAKADRAYVWKNSDREGLVFSAQIYEWPEGAEILQGRESHAAVPMGDMPGGWEDALSRGQCINGPVKALSPEEQDKLSPRGIRSILVIPVFLREEFWGFMGFCDSHSERYFSSDEERILRSGSLLIINAVLRNEVTANLVQAREEALSSTRAKSDFLANISHEIRTPINAITGMAAIARSTEDSSRIRDCLGKIDAASRQLLALINDVLDMSKIEANRFELAREAFELKAAIHNVKSIVGVKAAEKRQTLRLSIADTVPEIAVGDDMRLSQVLLNLLSNAVKFTPEYGYIHFSVRLVDCRDGVYELEAIIRDSGIGMTAEQLGRLFGKFEQADRGIARRFGGTGLGLVISKNIVEMMHGYIRVESTPGEGSCFTVRFFLEAGSRDMVNQRKNEMIGQADFSGHTVLLVEDVEINREIVLAFFEKTGLCIECAENGQAALDLFSRDPEKYDLIFMDVQMPVMDGYSATRTLRRMDLARARSIPIIAMTANAFSDDVENCRNAGMDDHIAKPIDIGELLEKTVKYLS